MSKYGGKGVGGEFEKLQGSHLFLYEGKGLFTRSGLIVDFTLEN